MKLIFIDEVEQPQKNANFFGVGALIIDSTFYRGLRSGVEEALDEANWDTDTEFKGRYLFSNTLGDESVPVESRIELVRKIVAKTTAEKNARARFSFAYNFSGRGANSYLDLVRRSVGRCPKSTSMKGDKNLAIAYYDETKIAEPDAITDVVEDALDDRGRVLVETPTELSSSNRAPGLIVADVLAYLKSWDVLSPDPDEAAQASLFETTVGQIHAKKLRAIREILAGIKRVDVVAP